MEPGILCNVGDCKIERKEKAAGILPAAFESNRHLYGIVTLQSLAYMNFSPQK